MKTRLLILMEDGGAPLGAVWLYVRRDGKVQLARTERAGDNIGVAQALNKKAEDKKRYEYPWEYTDPFVIDVPPEEIEVYHSKGAKPIPLQLFDDLGEVFIKRPLEPSTVPATTARVGPNVRQKLAALPTMAVRVPPIPIDVTVTSDVSVGTCVGEIDDPGEGAGAEPAPKPTDDDDDKIPIVLAHTATDHVDVAGHVPAPARSVRLRVLDASHAVIKLRESPTAKDDVDEITCPTKPGAEGDPLVTFGKTLYFAQKFDVFAPASFVVSAAEGLKQPVLEVFGVSVCDAPPTGKLAPAPASDLGFPLSVLSPLSTPERTRFKRHVYCAHVAWAYGVMGKRFVFGIPIGYSLKDVGTQQMRGDAADSCIALLAKARSDCTADKSALAKKVLGWVSRPAIRAASGFRDANKELYLWQKYCPRYYFESAKARVSAGAVEARKGTTPTEKDQIEVYAAWEMYFPDDFAEAMSKPGDEHGPAAAYAMSLHFRGLKAAPGYSNHTNGIAMDFGTTQEFTVEGVTGYASLGPSRKVWLTDEKGKHLGKEEVNAVELWKESWLFNWLHAHARKPFGFMPYDKEQWHWDYKPAEAAR